MALTKVVAHLCRFLSVQCDVPLIDQYGLLQDPATPAAEGMVLFHDELMFFIVLIGIAFLIMLSEILLMFRQDNPERLLHPVDNFAHASTLEIVWTILPAVILFFISVPSFTLLYSLDELAQPLMTLKIIGHQWYWSYQWTNHEGFSENFIPQKTSSNIQSIDAYVMPKATVLGKKVLNFRLLSCTRTLLLPVKTHIRLLITSADVLHSWAVPSFGVKVDACPGRLSQASLFLKREGRFFGQCSEICGVNHGFMPIEVRVISEAAFLEWKNIFVQNYLKNV